MSNIENSQENVAKQNPGPSDYDLLLACCYSAARFGNSISMDEAKERMKNGSDVLNTMPREGNIELQRLRKLPRPYIFNVRVSPEISVAMHLAAKDLRQEDVSNNIMRAIELEKAMSIVSRGNIWLRELNDHIQGGMPADKLVAAPEPAQKTHNQRVFDEYFGGSQPKNFPSIGSIGAGLGNPVEINSTAPEKSGGSVNYYKVQINDPTSGSNNSYMAECNDIIEALNMNYTEANIFKAIWRMAAARELGKLKEGFEKPKYDTEKVVFFANRLMSRLLNQSNQQK